MKRELIYFACIVLALVSCDKEHDHSNDQPSVKQGVHYFYVKNELDQDIFLEFNTMTYDNGELSKDYQINERYKVVAFRKDTTLVRVYDRGFPNTEALNCFYYQSVLLTVDNNRTFCNVLYPGSGLKSTDIWKGKYWYYKQIGKWKANYTLVINEELLKELFPEQYPVD